MRKLPRDVFLYLSGTFRKSIYANRGYVLCFPLHVHLYLYICLPRVNIGKGNDLKICILPNMLQNDAL